MARRLATPRSGANPRDLTLEAILEAAARIADSSGLEALTVRSLAQDLGVAPMTLYGHVESKDAMLNKMAARLLERFEVPAVNSDDWGDHVRAIMISFRQLLELHPSLVRLLSTRRVTSVGLTRSAEATLWHLRNAGFTDRECVQAYASLFAYTLGFVVFQTPRLPDVPRESPNSDESVEAILRSYADARHFPVIGQLAGQVARMARGGSFEFGLDALIEGLRCQAREPLRARARGGSTRRPRPIVDDSE